MTDRLTLTRLRRHIHDLVGIRPEWEELASCAQTDPEAFFPEKGQSARQALRICNGGPGREACPVRTECLNAALAQREYSGVWGGLRASELRKLVKPLLAADRAANKERKAKAAAAQAAAREAKAKAKAAKTGARTATRVAA